MISAIATRLVYICGMDYPSTTTATVVSGPARRAPHYKSTQRENHGERRWKVMKGSARSSRTIITAKRGLSERAGPLPGCRSMTSAALPSSWSQLARRPDSRLSHSPPVNPHNLSRCVAEWHAPDIQSMAGIACAVGETVILLHPPSTFSRCFNSDGERASAE